MYEGGIRLRLWEEAQRLSFNLDSSLSMPPHTVMTDQKMMNAYYQQAPGYEYGDPPPSEQPERVAKSSNLPVRDTIAVDESDESSRDKKRESDKSSKYHRSPPVPRGNIAHPAAVRAAIAEV